MAACRKRPLRPRGDLLLAILCSLSIACQQKQAAPDASPGSSGADSAEAPEWLRPDSINGYSGGQHCEASSQCLSGACTSGVCSEWSGVMRITVDTTHSGADVQVTVNDFPLLVRLSSTNFVFTEARSDGADVRFLDAQGNSLHHEIERWDPGHGVAEIWVLVPRIEGNSRRNSLFMYWGNPTAARTSSGASVFGGYTSVFHMTDSPMGLTDEIADASTYISTEVIDSTGNGHTGIIEPAPTSNKLHTEACAAEGLLLDGQTSMSTQFMEEQPRLFSISLWLKTSSSLSCGIACFASLQTGTNGGTDRILSLTRAGKLQFADLNSSSNTPLSTLGSYNDDSWHYIVAQVSDESQTLYVDGDVVVDQTASPSTHIFDGYWHLGQDMDGQRLAGILDEVRLTDHVLSDDWVKLCFATERLGSTAVLYER